MKSRIILFYCFRCVYDIQETHHFLTLKQTSDKHHSLSE